MARHDFDGDGKSDVLWSTTSGLVLWSSVGLSFVASQRADGRSFNANSTGGAVGWSILDTIDYTGDGHADVFFSKVDGDVLYNQIHFWDQTRFVGAGTAATGLISEDTEMLAGDFTSDGIADLLLLGPDGSMWVQTYAFNPAPSRGSSYLPPDQIFDPVGAAVGSGWHLVAAADFNGDGENDILWRNDSGLVTTWLGTGSSDDSRGFAANDANSVLVDNSWHVAETGDFNGDGMADILWRNDDGQITHWLSKGDSFDVSSVFSLNVSTSWQVGQTGDYDGDGRDDILWINDNGLVTTWLSNGLAFAANDANTTSVPDGFLLL